MRGGVRQSTLVLASEAERRASASNIHLQNTDALQCYGSWPSPTCIISDGPYGLGKFPGEPNGAHDLARWYAPHVAAWAEFARTDTTLWFWSSELGWANAHSLLELHGWHYEECCIWDKGIAHVAGNCNGKTIRGMPVVSEVAVRYTKRNLLQGADGRMLTIKEWVTVRMAAQRSADVESERGLRCSECCNSEIPDAVSLVVFPAP